MKSNAVAKWPRGCTRTRSMNPIRLTTKLVVAQLTLIGLLPILGLTAGCGGQGRNGSGSSRGLVASRAGGEPIQVSGPVASRADSESPAMRTNQNSSSNDSNGTSIPMPTNRGTLRGSSSGGGGFVDENSSRILHEAAVGMANMIRFSSPEIYDVLPEGWTAEKLATVIQTVRYEPFTEKIREGKALMFDYGVDAQGEFIVALKPFFVAYSSFPIKFSNEEAKAKLMMDVRLKLVHEAAHHLGFNEEKSEKFGLAVIEAQYRDVIYCRTTEDDEDYPHLKKDEREKYNKLKLEKGFSDPTPMRMYWVFLKASGIGLYYRTPESPGSYDGNWDESVKKSEQSIVDRFEKYLNDWNQGIFDIVAWYSSNDAMALWTHGHASCLGSTCVELQDAYRRTVLTPRNSSGGSTSLRYTLEVVNYNLTDNGQKKEVRSHTKEELSINQYQADGTFSYTDLLDGHSKEISMECKTRFARISEIDSDLKR